MKQGRSSRKSGTLSPLQGQRGVVTGASSGIGEAVACGLAEAGARVCLIGRNEVRLEAAAEKINDILPGASSYYAADLTLDEEIVRLRTLVEREGKTIDILVHSAGLFSMGYIRDATLEDFDRQFRTNVRAPYALTKALLPLIRQGKGQIVFVNSTAALIGSRAGLAQYTAVKYALKAVADSLREEVNADGIRVISVYPGRTATPMQEHIHTLEGKVYQPDRLLQAEDVARAVIGALSMPWSAEITDVTVRPMRKPA